MGLKKNYFKHLEYGVHSPVKQKIDVRDPEFIPEEVQKLLNKDPRELTIEEVQKLPPPENETDYKARTYLRPEDPLDPEAGPEEKLMNFVYNNPMSLTMASKIPGISDIVKDKIKGYMRESGGGAAGRTLDGYKKYVDEIQSSNDEFGYNEEILSEEDWNLENQIDPYTGGMEEKGIRSTHWRAGGPTAIDQMFDKKDLFPINTKAASDPIYPWMKSRSIKGDDFAKNLNEIDPGLNVTLRPSVTEPPWSDEEHYNSLSEEEQIAADEAYVSSLNDEKVGSLRTNTMLTNRQLVPFLLEDMMMNTLDWKGRSATENSPRIPGIIDKHPDAYRLGSDFDNPEGTAYGSFGGYKDNPLIDEAFQNFYDQASKGKYQSKTHNTPNIMAGDGAENVNVSSFYNMDFGGQRSSFGWDDKLPYGSTSDAFDFYTGGKGGYSESWGPFKKAQLLQQASELWGGGHNKYYDRLYFTPDKHRDLIPEKDVPFFQEAYGSNQYADEETMIENNPDWIQPEMLDEVVINVSKKEEEKTPGTTHFEELKAKQ